MYCLIEFYIILVEEGLKPDVLPSENTGIAKDRSRCTVRVYFKFPSLSSPAAVGSEGLVNCNPHFLGCAESACHVNNSCIRTFHSNRK